MEQSSFSRFLKVTVNLILGIAFLLVTRVLARSIHIPGLLGEAIRLALFTFLNYRCMRALAKRSGLGLGECYISRPSFRLPGVLIGLTLPAAFCLVLTLVPGKFSCQQLPAGYIFTVLLPLIIDTGLGSGINEELVFRGYLLRMVEENYGRKAAILITSLVFGAIHLLNQPLPFLEALLFFAFTASLGILFSILTVKSGSIWNAVLVHGLVNTWGVLFTSGSNSGLTSPLVYTLSGSLPIWLTGGEASAPVSYTVVIWIMIAVLCLKGRQKTEGVTKG